MPSEPAADIVLRGGAVHTVDDARPKAKAIAIRAGRIAAMGADREVGGLIGPRTRVIELRGRTVLPGFQDAHVHPPESGLDELRCDVREPRDSEPLDVDGLVELIRAAAFVDKLVDRTSGHTKCLNGDCVCHRAGRHLKRSWKI